MTERAAKTERTYPRLFDPDLEAEQAPDDRHEPDAWDGTRARALGIVKACHGEMVSAYRDDPNVAVQALDDFYLLLRKRLVA